VTGFAKRDRIPHSKCAYFKEAYFRNAMRNPNQRWVFYGGGVAAAMTRANEVLGLRHPGEFRGGVHGICDRGKFFEKWHYYEGAYLRNGESFGLLAWDGIS